MASIDGKLVSIDQDAREELEFELKLRTQSRVQPRGSCREFWILGRKNLDKMCLCLRLPRNATRVREKGALAPELAALLVLASKPEKDDVFLDPFGGSGAIGDARLGYPHKAVIYSDIRRQQVSPALMRRSKSDRRVRLLKDDALSLRAIRDGEVTVIVTDPPWGEFDRLSMPYRAFADAVAASFDRVLHPESGRFVILVTRNQAETLARSLAGRRFRIHATHQILVNGHPASVIVGGR